MRQDFKKAGCSTEEQHRCQACTHQEHWSLQRLRRVADVGMDCPVTLCQRQEKGLPELMKAETL
jgi:hypothetical protein